MYQIPWAITEHDNDKLDKWLYASRIHFGFIAIHSSNIGLHRKTANNALPILFQKKCFTSFSASLLTCLGLLSRNVWSSNHTLGVLCGIPQGSCLGPLLFIVYLNDFGGCLDFSKANMYADDTHTTIVSNDIRELVRMTKKELLNISDWLRVNKLSANPKITEFMVIGHQRRINEIDDLPPLKLNDSEIKRVEKTKSLGVIIDEGLKWKDQYKSLTGKLAGGLSSLKKLKDVHPQSKLCDVYHALFESHIRYGNVVWGSISSSELQALQRLQNRALSIIERARFKDPWPKKWLSVVNLVRFDRCVMVYKILNKQCPESLWNMFQQRCSISNYNTRNYRDLHIPKLNLELTKKGFHYSGIKAWNDIPVNIRELPSLRLFKTHLKRHLMTDEL